MSNCTLRGERWQAMVVLLPLSQQHFILVNTHTHTHRTHILWAFVIANERDCVRRRLCLCTAVWRAQCLTTTQDCGGKMPEFRCTRCSWQRFCAHNSGCQLFSILFFSSVLFILFLFLAPICFVRRKEKKSRRQEMHSLNHSSQLQQSYASYVKRNKVFDVTIWCMHGCCVPTRNSKQPTATCNVHTLLY